MRIPSVPIEPRFARVAAAIGDPTRARMLAVLLGGASLPAGEIAQAAGVNRSTASQHLGKLAAEGIVAVDPRGRHRYFRVASADVARALEALSMLAERADTTGKWLREPYRRLKYARSCYHHLAGELGVRLLHAMLARRVLAAGNHGYELPAAGDAWLADLGLVLRPRSRERVAYGCLDWSERREHLAGPLATSLLGHFTTQRWLVRADHPRALKLTPQGRRYLLPLL